MKSNRLDRNKDITVVSDAYQMLRNDCKIVHRSNTTTPVGNTSIVFLLLKAALA